MIDYRIDLDWAIIGQPLVFDELIEVPSLLCQSDYQLCLEKKKYNGTHWHVSGEKNNMTHTCVNVYLNHLVACSVWNKLFIKVIVMKAIFTHKNTYKEEKKFQKLSIFEMDLQSHFLDTVSMNKKKK